MNIDIIRWIDEYINGIICFLLSRLKFSNKKNEMKKFLIIKIWGIGSIINASPVISCIKSKIPNSKVCLMTMSNNKGLYDNNPEIDKIYYLNLKNIYSSIKDIFLISYKIKKEKIDVLIDFEISSNSTAIINYLINPALAIGYKSGKSKDKLFDKLVDYKEGAHITEIFCESLKPLNLECKNLEFIQPNVSESDKIIVNNLLNSRKIKEFVIVNINASNVALERRLPLENFKKIAEYLVKDLKMAVVLIGSKFERAYVEQFISSLDSELFNFAGLTDIVQLYYLMQKSKLVITNDSGPLHLAVLSGAPTISFFGPETPKKYGPLGEKHTVIYKGVSCSPCMNVFKSKKIKCMNNVKCLSEISFEEIKEAIDKRLKK